MKTLKQLVGFAAVAALAADAQAALVRIGAGSFTPQASVITFSEFPVSTVNPHYSLSTVSLGTVAVDFEGHFVGQAETGGGVNTLSDHTPTNPLTLDPAASDTFITLDGSFPTSPTLTGSPMFNGPIAVKFSVPVAAVGLQGGFFNAVGATAIEGYDASGASLGIVHNSTADPSGTDASQGIEFFGLADSTGAAVISGISFYIDGSEPFGFNIDNLTFGSGAEVIIPGGRDVPEASTVAAAVALASLVGGTWLRRRRALALA